MANKRRFKEDESGSNKRLLKDFNSNNLSADLNDRAETTQSSDVQTIVKDLVTELIDATDNELNDQLIDGSTTYQQNDFNQIDFTHCTAASQDLDDSFKLNYDFNLINNDALYNSQEFVNSFTEPTLTPTTLSAPIVLNSPSPILNSTVSEHNYANVPTTSFSASNGHSNQTAISGSRPIKGALKFHDAIKSTSSNKKNVKFKGVTVFYFPRNQGGSTVPSQGGSTLGMEMNHTDSKNFTLDAHQEEKRQVHREILLRQKRYERMYQKKQQARLSNLTQSDSDDDSVGNISDISDSELEFDSWYFLQPVPVKQRRALLRESGITKIDSSEKEECRDIRLSREFCGCECRVYCDEATCQCSLNGIKCQVDRLNFPCGCSRDSCNNLNGRTEFNPIRVRTHFIHTIMRLELEKKNESQQFNDQSLNPSTSTHHLKPNSSSSTTTPNIELINQATLYSPLNSTQPQLFTSSNPSSMQTNEIYTIESPNNTNILNCTESVSLANDTYDLYDSGDTGSSSYSENSDCTNDDLDCTLTANTVTNGLSFSSSLSPFSLISTVPTTNNELIINGSTILNYDNQNYHQTAAATTPNFLTDQSFRYLNYSSTHNVQTDQNLMINQATTNDHQLINHHLNSYYYQDASSLYHNNLSTVDCYSTQQPDLSKPILNHTVQPQLTAYNELTVEQPFIETHHYTDLSQSIASSKSSAELFAVASSSNFDLECGVAQLNGSTMVVNSSDDSSSSGQSSNANLEDNYLTSGESTQNDEDNFGEIIKNTVSLESVTA